MRWFEHTRELGSSNKSGEEDYQRSPETPGRPPVETTVHTSGTLAYFNKLWEIVCIC